MNCRDARTEIALSLGHDETDESRWEEVRRHVSTCVPCRVHYRRLKEALSALDHADPPSTYETRDSLWPELASRLDAQPRRASSSGYGNWLPYASFIMACMLFVVVWTYQPNPPANHSAPALSRGAISSLPDFSTKHSGRDEKQDRDEKHADENAPEF